MKLLKKSSIGLYLQVAVVVAMLVSMIAAIVSSSVAGYKIDSLGLVIALTIIAILAMVLSVVYGVVRDDGNGIISYLGLFVAMILSGICFILVISARTYLIGTLWVTALDSVNPLAVSALNSGATSFIAYIVAMVLAVVASFFKNVKQ